jgi:septal ring factor EnvC (AmiA/AmiB activator)
VNQLRGVSFEWNKKPGKKIFGVIAQEVEEVIPELVHTNETENEDGFKQKSIHYDGITPYLIESIKALTNEQTQLKQENESIKQEVELLKTKMNKYDALFEKLLHP